MIIYIHGFGSSGYGGKSTLMREYFRSMGKDFIAPSLSYIPDLAIATLEELIESYDENISLVGSSLGGYYSIYLAQKYNLKAVLINPSIKPFVTLEKCLGYAPSFFDDSSFEWKKSHLNMLEKYDISPLTQENFLLLLQKGDETLDYREATEKFAAATLIIEEGGSHSFDGIGRHFETICDHCVI